MSQILAEVQFGNYIAWWKALILLVVLLVWARLLTWADKDAEAAHMPRIAINLGFLSGLIIAFVLFLALPGFWLALAVFVVFMLAEIGVYLALRHQKVGLGDLGKQFKDWVRSLTTREKEIKAEAGQVLLISKGGAPFPPPEAESPELAAYSAVQSLLTESLRRSAERIEMRPGESAAAVKYWVDGMAIDGPTVPKDDASAAVVLLKELAEMDLADRRKPQKGTMKAALDGRKRDLQIMTAGSTAGESISIDVDAKQRYELQLDQLGFTEDQLNKFEEVIGEGQGIVLLAAPHGHGLTTLLYAILRRHDAFLSHIQTIERTPRADLEGITQNKLAGNAPADEAKMVNWVASQEPDMLMVDRVEDPGSARDIIKYAASGRRAYVGVRAGTTFEALQAWRTLVGDDKHAMKHLRLVVAGRLVRKLCTACKVDYNPDPDTLRRLNMPPERVGKLFTARTTPLLDQRGHEIVCEFCLDLRFRGRTGIFELFIIDDEVRQVVQAGGSVNQLKMLFKKQRQKYLPEQALARAVTGVTSLQEVVRVLRAGAAPAATPAAQPGKKVRTGDK